MNEAGGQDPLSCLAVAGSGEVLAFGTHDGSVITVRSFCWCDDVLEWLCVVLCVSLHMGI